LTVPEVPVVAASLVRATRARAAFREAGTPEETGAYTGVITQRAEQVTAQDRSSPTHERSFHELTLHSAA
jgi:hypothetical protein